MLSAGELRGWLLQQPRPKTLRCVATDGQEHRIEVQPGTVWSHLAESISAIGPDRIEAFGEKGELLRACRPNEAKPVEESDDEEATPEGPDPETVRFTIVAKLIADAYRHSNEVAFEKLAALFDAMVTRGATMEKALDAMYRLTLKNLEAQAIAQAEGTGQGTLLEQMFGAYMQGQAMKGSGAAKPNGSPEGGT